MNLALLATMTVLATITGITAAPEKRLTLIHTNDILSHFDEMGGTPRACKGGASCYGGIPRLIHMIREERKKNPNVLVVDSGGLMNTQLLKNPSGRELITDLVGLVGFDAMAIGRPEMLGGLDALQQYMDLHKNIPYLCTDVTIRINGSDAAKKCRDSAILTIGGIKIGIVSALSHELKPPGLPEATIAPNVRHINKVISNLREVQSAQIVVGLIYFKEDVDSRFLRKVPDIDVVVTAHQKGLFYNGRPSHGEYVTHPYPYEVKISNKRRTLVVSAYSCLHYAGLVELAIDGDTIVDYHAKNPVLLLGSKDIAAEKVMSRLREQQDDFLGGMVAITSYFLDGSRRCRKAECSLGDIVTDAMLESAIEPEYLNEDVIAWSKVSAAILDGGAVRESIAPGPVRYEDVRMSLVSPIRLVVVSVTGQVLLESLQVAGNDGRRLGDMMQLSGLRVKLNRSAPVGRRIHSVSIICTVCQLPAYQPVDPLHTYRIVTSNRLASGSDGVKLFDELTRATVQVNTTVIKATVAYMRKISPIARGVDIRIVIAGNEPVQRTSVASTSWNSAELGLTVVFALLLRGTHVIH